MNKVFFILAAAFFTFILWAIYVANTGGNSIFMDAVRRIPHGDKIGHIILFGMLTLLINLTFKLNTLRLWKLKGYYGTLTVSVFVVVEEFSQLFASFRTFDVLDLLADAFGITAATLICWVVKRRNSIVN